MKSLIGNTPLVKIRYNYNGKVNSIYTKLEFYNFVEPRYKVRKEVIKSEKNENN